MSQWELLYFKTDRGELPVKEFVATLTLDSRRKYYRKLDYLASFGPGLPRPHAAYLKDEIYELRFQGTDGTIRILYFFFHKRQIVLVHAFKKETDAVPEREVELALTRKALFISNPHRYGL